MEHTQLRTAVQAAEAYCQAIERAVTSDDPHFLQELFVRLAELYPYVAAIANRPALLQVESVNADMVAVSTYEEARAVERSLAARIGSRDFYHEFFDPFDETSAVSTTLSDDLSDIYGDVLGALRINDVAATASDVATAAELVESFRLHWGMHAIDALRAMHRLVLEN